MQKMRARCPHLSGARVRSFQANRTYCGIGACGADFVSRNSSYMPIDLKPCAKEAGTVPASFWPITDLTRATPELRDAKPAPHAPRKRGHGCRRIYPPAHNPRRILTALWRLVWLP